MADRRRTLRVSSRSIAVTVGGLGLTFLALRMAEGAGRVLGWIAAAGAIALLLAPAVERLARRLPRGIAVLAVAVVALGSVGVAAYGVGTSLVRQYDALQEAAPRYARQAEESKRFGSFAREVRAVERTTRFVDRLPERLRGGEPAEAVRAAATRGVAFVATGILAIFFLLHGGRILDGAVQQLPTHRRESFRRVGRAAVRRATSYALATLCEAVLAGMAGYGVARAIGAPGAAPLGLWVALWDVVPVVGAAIGALPIVAIAGTNGLRQAAAVTAFFAGYQVVETILVQRRIERRTMRLGPFLTALAGAAGLEAYGLGGALIGLLAMALGVAILLEAGTQMAAGERVDAGPEDEPAEARADARPDDDLAAEPPTAVPAEPGVPPFPSTGTSA